MSQLAALRGFNDIIFTQGKNFQNIIDIAAQSAQIYGYQIGHFPILESTNVFKRSLGESSDVVSKEMYSFLDRNEESVTMRPEFTAVIARAIITNSLYHQLPFKFFSYGPLFRYERPQRGRFRQFHQLNFENYSLNSKGCDIDIILLINHIVNALNISDKLTLEINNLGCEVSRNNYTNSLITYLEKYKNDLSEDSQKRLVTNPLRILDSKSEQDKKILTTAPSLNDYHTDTSKAFFAEIESALTANNIAYKKNNLLVRGLDYYNNFVFEFTTNLLGSQNAVFAGGRYDKLFNILGSKQEVKAVGAAGGIERLVELAEFNDTKLYDLTIIPMDDNLTNLAIQLAEKARKQGVSCNVLFSSGNLKKKLQKAESNSDNIIIFGEDEASTDKYKIKNLVKSTETNIVPNDINNFIQNHKI